jgi:hypothetical protein
MNTGAKTVEVSVVDNLGRIVHQSPFNAAESYDLPINLKPGLYFIRISSNDVIENNQRLLVID